MKNLKTTNALRKRNKAFVIINAALKTKQRDSIKIKSNWWFGWGLGERSKGDWEVVVEGKWKRMEGKGRRCR